MLIHNSLRFASLEARHQNLIRAAVDKYLAILNADEPPEPYTLGYFLDSNENEYADPIVKLLLESDEDMDILIRIALHDGQAGGPSELFIHARRDYEFEPTGKTVHAIRYEHSEIESYNTGPGGTNTLRKLDPPKEYPYNYPETELKFKDTYQLDLVIQYFDTMHQVVFNADDQDPR